MMYLIKKCSYLLTFNLTNSMNFHANFPSLMRYYLPQGDAHNGASDSIPRLHTVNIYRYKAIGANATSSVILYTGKCISPCLEIL